MHSATLQFEQVSQKIPSHHPRVLAVEYEVDPQALQFIPDVERMSPEKVTGKGTQSSSMAVWACVEIHSSIRGCFGASVAAFFLARSPLRVISKQSTQL